MRRPFDIANGRSTSDFQLVSDIESIFVRFLIFVHNLPSSLVLIRPGL